MSTPITVTPTIKKPLTIRPTKCQRGDACFLTRTQEKIGIETKKDFSFTKYKMSIQEAIEEAGRCLVCTNAPCQSCCPSQVNVPVFNHALGEGNLYGAAKVLFTNNPLGWTCGTLCPTNEYCRCGCTLADTLHGAIHINDLHCAAAEAFMHMKIPQIRNPYIKEEPYHKAKIAMIGAGPASLSCATFLARWGYQDITIFEKKSYAGGTPAIEIPEFRIPYYITRFEVKMVEDLGVKIICNKPFGKEHGMTIESLKAEGYDAIFIGAGIPEPTIVRPLRPYTNLPNVWDSKTFLRQVAEASKPGMVTENRPQLPDLSGRVVVLGAGDVAADCSHAAFRCGADFVSLVFRRGIIDMRMNADEAEGVRREKVEMLGSLAPKDFKVEDGKAVAVICDVMKKVPHTENYVKDNDQEMVVSFDHVITAFGSQVGPNLYEPVKLNEKWQIDVDSNTMACKDVEGVFAGGDCVGSGTIIAGVNDGKVAAWNINRYLAKKISNVDLPEQPAELPPFMTPIDLVDTSVEVAGLKFPNPFGLASGPSTESALLIKKAFQAGFGWVVAKTFQPDQDLLPNVSPRILGDAKTNSYMNIELNSERKVDYWMKELPKLKKEFPNNILLASIHCKGTPEEWAEFAKKIASTGVDGLQLNISCPNLGEAGAKPYSEIIKEVIVAVRAVVSIPLFPKIGHFQGDIVEIAKAAKEAGAAGVSGINTISGLADTNPMTGDFKIQVGKGEAARTAYGGVSGAPIRPFALMALTQVHKALPDFPYLAAGGAQNSITAWEFIQAGAPLVQFCSASMYKGAKLLFSELLPGLQFLLYTHNRPYFKEFVNGFMAPALLNRSHRKRFGLWQKEVMSQEIEEALAAPIPAEPKTLEEFVVKPTTEATDGKEVKVAEVTGESIVKIAEFSDLDPTIKVVSHIDTSRCLGCGRCQRACVDSGYSCIGFDVATRTPKVAVMACKGCGLCATVCPVHCITMVPAPPKPVPKVVPKAAPKPAAQ